MAEQPAANVTPSDMYLLPWEQDTFDAAPVLDEELPDEDNSDEDEPVPEESGDDEDSAPEDADEDLDESNDELDEEAEEEEPATRFKAKVNGEDVEVTLDELLAGYSRTVDYTRKTMQIAEQRKAAEQEAAQMRETREQYAKNLTLLEQALNEMAPPEPNWETLRKENPAEYAAQYAERQQYQQQVQTVHAEQQRLYAAQQAEYEAEMDRRLVDESEKLLNALPEWRDQTKADAGKRAILDYALGLGYTEDDLSNVYDHRALLMMDKARRWDALQAKGVQQVRDKAVAAPKRAALKPGSAPVVQKKGPAQNAQRAMNRLNRSGSVNDAAAALAFMLDD
jgi:hypothetical protein